MRADLCANNRIMNRTNVMTRRRNSHVTHAELCEIASVERSHRRISRNPTITFSHIPKNFFNAMAGGNPLICIWRILNNVVHCHARAVILDSSYFSFFPPTIPPYFLSLFFFYSSSPRSSANVYFLFLSDNYIFDKQRITFPLKVVRKDAVERGI